MSLTKTTIRLDAELKKAAQREAVEQDSSLQDVINRVLKTHFEKPSTNRQISPGFESWVDKYIETNRQALEELAHK